MQSVRIANWFAFSQRLPWRYAVYASLLGRRRRELHQAAGSAIEARYPNRLADYDEELSHHFTLGEVWPKAMTYSTLAGDRAAGAHAYAETRAHYACALEAADQLDPPADPITLANLHEKHAAVLTFFIEYEAAASEYHKALALVRQVGERQRESELLAELSIVYNYAHHPESAIGMLQTSIYLIHSPWAWLANDLSCHQPGPSVAATGQAPGGLRPARAGI